MATIKTNQDMTKIMKEQIGEASQVALKQEIRKEISLHNMKHRSALDMLETDIPSYQNDYDEMVDEHRENQVQYAQVQAQRTLLMQELEKLEEEKFQIKNEIQQYDNETESLKTKE